MNVCGFATCAGPLSVRRNVARNLSGKHGRRETFRMSTGGREHSRRAFILDGIVILGGVLSSSAVHAASVTEALSGVVRVRDGVSELIDGETSGIDINRAIKLLVKGTDLRGDGEKLAKFYNGNGEEIIDGIRDAREMMDLATQYYFAQGKKSATPQQAKVTAEALGRAREILDGVINRFDDDVVKEARLIVSGPI